MPKHDTENLYSNLKIPFQLLTILIVLTILITSCTKVMVHDWEKKPGETFFDAKTHPASKYIGVSKEVLIRDYGEPDGIINVTLLGGPPSIAYVYAPRKGSSCINAFVITLEDDVIRKYFCR